jgi:two-component system chemotaxis sensor kinase CheA
MTPAQATPAPAAPAPAAPAPAAHVEPAHEAAATDSGSLRDSILRVDANRIDDVLNLVGELIIGKSMLLQTVGEFDKRFAKDPLRGKFADAMAFQARVLTDLQKSVMKIRMVPVEQLFRRVPRIMRDVAKAAGKEVALQISGQDTDLDKSILDTLAEPLTHLVRNAVDHGLETPQERIALGKPAVGTIRLNAFHQGNQVVIEVGDDGRGIDREKVVAKAIERGIVTADEAARMSEGEQLALIFHPGLSTAAQITAVSGRGVGMDVVKTVLDELKGTVGILTKVGEGTTFQLKVPLTLAIIKALLFRTADRLYAVPLGSVLEITRTSEGQIHRVDNHEVLQLRNEVLTLVRVAKLSKRKAAASKKLFIVVIALGDRKFGLVVDKLVGEEELVIKALDDHLVATELVSGASILGDGTVVLILNLQAVVNRVGRDSAKGAHA